MTDPLDVVAAAVLTGRTGDSILLVRSNPRPRVDASNLPMERLRALGDRVGVRVADSIGTETCLDEGLRAVLWISEPDSTPEGLRVGTVTIVDGGTASFGGYRYLAHTDSGWTVTGYGPVFTAHGCRRRGN